MLYGLIADDEPAAQVYSAATKLDQAMTMPPAPERYAAQFCQHYCSYFGDSCGGKGKEVTAEVIKI